MNYRIGKMIEFSVAPLACWLLVAMAGCSSEPEAALPQQQADAVKALKASNVKVAFRDGEVIYVDFYNIPDTASAMVHLKAFPHLEKLNFSSANVTDDDLVHLANLTELKELSLNRTPITDNGLVHLAGLTKLELLNFNEVGITDAGLVHLQNLKELKQLHLNQTEVSGVGLKHLAGLERLENLLLYGTSVSESGATAFREHHPDTEVVVSEDAKDADKPASE